MKVRNLFFASFLTSIVGAALVIVTCAANTAIALTIVDGTAPGYLLDGSFESGSDGSPVDWLGNDNSTALAADLGISLNMIYRMSPANPSDGSQYTVVGENGTGGIFGVYLDTGYDLATGDLFDLSFFHGAHSSVEGGESMRWQLFTTTTNTDAGVIADTIATGTVVVPSSTTLTLETLTDIGSVASSSAGDRLFLAYTPVSTVGTISDFFALDQVNLSVTSLPVPPVPEPGSMTLMLFGILGGCLLRRKRKSAA